MRLTVLESRAEELKRAVGKSSKKYGIEVGFQIVSEHFEQIEFPTGERGIFKFQTVEISSSFEKEGWKVVGVVERDNGINIVKDFDFSDKIPSEFFNTELECDHCHKKKKRNSICIVKNTNTGEYRRVGSRCVEDYTSGCLDYNSVHNLTKLFNRIDKTEKEEYCYDKSYEQYEKVDIALLYSIETIDKFGYVKKDNTFAQSEIPTVYRVSDYISILEHNYYVNQFEKEAIINELQRIDFNPKQEKNVEKIEKIKNWIFQQDSDNSYFNNLQHLLSQEFFNRKYLSYIASSYVSWKRSMTEDSKSEFVGTVGDKIEISVKSITTVFTYESGYHNELVKIYKILDHSGNVFIWKTSKIINNAVLITGKVKSHNMRNNVKQTEIFYCKYH